MRKSVLVFAGLLIGQLAIAQVTNNSFKDRIHLSVDSTLLYSTTAKATVEWECVNKVLTNSCLVYHNDQWFYFTLKETGDYYLNILNQHCRDRRGVQVLVIEGNPCETSDYRIVQCVSQGLQNDVFISLQSLQSGVPYLINIDGFLGDFCDFDIQIATKPLGFPMHYDRKDTVEVKTIQSGKLVEIRWVVPRDRIDLFEKFTVYKKRIQDRRTTLNREVMLERNTYGQPVLHYSFLDTLRTEGEYIYSILGIHKNTLIPILVGENTVRYFEEKAEPIAQSHMLIPLTNSMSEDYEVMVYDYVNSVMLTKYKAYVDLNAAKELDVDLSGYMAKGLKSFMILISDLSTGEKKEYYCRLDKSGKLVEE